MAHKPRTANAIAAALSIGCCCVFLLRRFAKKGQGRRVVVVQLLCTNDTHSAMDPVATSSMKGLAQCGETVGGVLRRAQTLRQMSGEVPATLVLDAGDHFTGSNFFSFLQGVAEMAVVSAHFS